MCEASGGIGNLLELGAPSAKTYTFKDPGFELNADGDQTAANWNEWSSDGFAWAAYSFGK